MKFIRNFFFGDLDKFSQSLGYPTWGMNYKTIHFTYFGFRQMQNGSQLSYLIKIGRYGMMKDNRHLVLLYFQNGMKQ
ncbi:hypothetical protein ASG81_24770 [Paenibacillus sp. Soil522]|nr:hypothetical protein ASG81_24770 [Paenibacillus sp. Soil522]